MPLINYLGIITILSFVVVLLFTKELRRSYLIFSVCAIPLIDIPITPGGYGSLRIFDAISYLTFVVLFREFVAVPLRKSIYYYLYFLLVLVTVLGSLASESVFDSLLSVLAIFPIFIYAKLLIDECLCNEDFMDQLLLLLKIAGIVSILFLIVQIVVGLDFTFYDRLNPNSIGSGFNRYPGFFHDPQKFAQFLVMLSFVFLYEHKTKRITYGSVALFGITAYALFLTGSRSALIGLCIGVLVLLVFLDARMKIAVLTGAALGAIPLMYFSNTFLILGRIGELNENYQFRNSIWKSALEIFADNPLLGIGTGNYQNYLRDHAIDQYFIYENAVQYFDQPENGYLKILVELGVFGASVLFLLLLLPIARAIISYFTGNKHLGIAFFIASIISCLVAFNSVYSFSDKRVIVVITTLLCFLISIHQREKLRNDEDHQKHL